MGPFICGLEVQKLMWSKSLFYLWSKGCFYNMNLSIAISLLTLGILILYLQGEIVSKILCPELAVLWRNCNLCNTALVPDPYHYFSPDRMPSSRTNSLGSSSPAPIVRLSNRSILRTLARQSGDVLSPLRADFVAQIRLFTQLCNPILVSKEPKIAT